MEVFNKFFNYLNNICFEFFYFEEVVTVVLVYNFYKLIVMSSLMELMWPTHFFNRKNTILFKFCRKRAFLEFLIYGFRPYIRTFVINRFFVKYMFLKKFNKMKKKPVEKPWKIIGYKHDYVNKVNYL